ncbi:MAG: UvrD-helicase domain-containing protein [bacterium]|nr:UvrD-helicase domain-containing protein [bacterium]
MKYLEGLNDAQKKAVLTTEGPVSVLAGAGAGKTRVLATRIYHLIREETPPAKILAVTFTNKAAREMRERVGALLRSEEIVARSESRRPTGREEAIFQQKNTPLTSSNNSERQQTPFIATFHGLGRELLESYGKVIGISRFFSIYDRDDSIKAVTKALKELEIETKELSPRAVLSRISKTKGEGATLAAFEEQHGHSSFGNRITAQVWRKYETTLKEEKALDFDDLIALPVRLLEAHANIRLLVQDRWSHIHIDEYQDTSVLQGRLIKLLVEKHNNLFVVGDIDQCIYTWRQATIENLLNFDKTYPEAQTIILEHNYRSTKNIVEAANTVIEKNKNRKEKRSTTDNPKGAPILLHAALSADDEARWIARKIKNLMSGAPLNASLRDASSEQASPVLAEEIAVLFRTNFQSRALEEGLLHASVPYRLLGTRFFERKEVKDCLSWVRLSLDHRPDGAPSGREADRMRAAQSPPRGIGKTTLGKLMAGQRDALRAGERTKVEQFEQIVSELNTTSETALPSEFVRLVIEKSGMKTALVGSLPAGRQGSDEDRERFENVQELATLATRHDQHPGKAGIAAFLAEAALASDQDEMDRIQRKAKTAFGGSPDGSNEPSRGVNLMTVHAAKGLEFDTVFVSGMEEGLFPHEGQGDEDRDEEEERRLFYVAMTRAKKRLILTLAGVRKIYGTDYLQEPSSFIADIDRSLLAFDETDGEPTIEA